MDVRSTYLYQISSLLPKENKIQTSLTPEVIVVKKALLKHIKSNDLNGVVSCLKKLPTDQLDLDIDQYPLLQHAIKARKKNYLKSSDSINMKIIYELLLAGANVNLASNHLNGDCFHQTPLKMALELKDHKLTTLLMQFGAKKLYQCDGNCILTKQVFKDKNQKIYEAAKNNIAKMRALFILARTQDPGSLLFTFPKELIAQILTCALIGRSNQKQIDSAKQLTQYEQSQKLRANSK